MNNIKIKVDGFLKRYKMHYDNININKSCKDFVEEMERGLRNEDSTLKMLCTYIEDDRKFPVNEPVIVMHTGGTKFRVAVVNFDINKKVVVEDLITHDMPGLNGEISKDEFFKTIVNYLKPVIHKSNKIGFCFSYPTEMLPNKDGKFIRFTKEAKISDMEGVEIGANLLQVLKEMGYEEDKKIVLLNDTTATLLGGKVQNKDKEYDSHIGFILGTGTNTCYIEENKYIEKAEGLLKKEGTTIMNIESGGYGLAFRGKIDEIFDNITADPGQQKFEKMVSGAYQGGLIFEVIKQAIENGLFSENFVGKMKNIGLLTTKEVDDFCNYPFSNNNILARCSNSENEGDAIKDKQTLYYIIDALIERAAKLIAINLAAVIFKTGRGRNPCMPVCITAEGSTLHRSKLLKSKLDYYLIEVLDKKLGIYCEFLKAENSILVGAAIAGLLN